MLKYLCGLKEALQLPKQLQLVLFTSNTEPIFVCEVSCYICAIHFKAQDECYRETEVLL